jgi:hypothetical protein
MVLSLTQIECVVGVSRVEVEEAATRLQDEAVTGNGMPIDGLPGTRLVRRDEITRARPTSLAP